MKKFALGALLATVAALPTVGRAELGGAAVRFVDSSPVEMVHYTYVAPTALAQDPGPPKPPPEIPELEIPADAPLRGRAAPIDDFLGQPSQHAAPGAACCIPNKCCIRPVACAPQVCCPTACAPACSVPACAPACGCEAACAPCCAKAACHGGGHNPIAGLLSMIFSPGGALRAHRYPVCAPANCGCVSSCAAPCGCAPVHGPAPVHGAAPVQDGKSSFDFADELFITAPAPPSAK